MQTPHPKSRRSLWLLAIGLCLALTVGPAAFSPAYAQLGGAISGTVFDTSQTPISGVTVELRDAAQNLLASVQTDASGQYLFQGLTSGGTYVIRVVPPSGLSVQQVLPAAPATAGSGGTILITNFDINTTYANNDFVLGPTAAPPPQVTSTISGSVIQDEDANGVIDVPPDVPIPGAQVLLQSSAGLTLATATTDSNGAYAFGGVGAGTYLVVQLVPANFSAVAAFPGPGAAVLSATTIQVTVNNGAVSSNNNFLDRSTVVSPTVGTISGLVIQDVDANGVIDVPPDVPLSGVTIELFTQLGTFVAQTTTDANGAYAFTDVPPGFYEVVQLVPSGLSPETPAVLSVQAIADVNQGNNNFLDVGTSPPPSTATISGQVIQDQDNNGVIDVPPDAPLPGVTVLLESSIGFTLQSTRTNSNGAYAFSNLSAGTYRVVQLVPSNFTPISVVPGPGGVVLSGTTIQVTVSAGTVSSGNDFLDRATVVSPTVGIISGSVFRDVDANGVLTVPPDVPIPGVAVDLFTSLGTFIAQSTTDQNGAWAFINVPPGSYQVEQIVPAGYTPETPTVLSVTAVAGVNQGNNNFLDLLSGTPSGGNTISGFAIEDQNLNGIADNEPGLAGMVITLENGSGTPLASVTTDITGSFSFSGLSGGTYFLVATPPAGRTSTNALPGQGGIRLSATMIEVVTSAGATNYAGQLFLAGP